MGMHILERKRGLLNDSECPISLYYPCGFCGKEMSKSCAIQIEKGYVSSSCTSSYKFRLRNAAIMTIAKPCTNVPIQCFYCSEIHWKYNMNHHLTTNHMVLQDHCQNKNLEVFLSNITISHAEEQSLGIPIDKIGVDTDSRGEKRNISSPVSPVRARHLKSLRLSQSGETSGGDSGPISEDVFN